MVKYSILQAVYKNDNPVYLDECFKSIKEQTYQPQEIILVKDGFVPEEIEDVLKKWEKDLPLTIVGYEANKGLAHALNYGMGFIKTEYTARMDSDDICYFDRFEKQLKVFENRNDLEICGTGILEFYDGKDNKRINKIRFYPETIDAKSKLLYRGTPLGHPTIMIKTELLQKYKYSERTSMNEDIDLWFRLIMDNHSIYNIQEPLLYFRITDGTFKRRSIKKAFNEYKIYTMYLKKLFGISFLQIYPLLRLVSRFLPYFVTRRLYFSKIRRKILTSNK